MNELKEKCGIVGIYGKGLPVSKLAFFALFALQHRGQEASGITRFIKSAILKTLRAISASGTIGILLPAAEHWTTLSR